jgi:hypothetical protein
MSNAKIAKDTVQTAPSALYFLSLTMLSYTIMFCITQPAFAPAPQLHLLLLLKDTMAALAACNVTLAPEDARTVISTMLSPTILSYNLLFVEIFIVPKV